MTIGSQGCFQPYGDVVFSGDTQADGRSSVTIVYTDYGREPFGCYNSTGANTWVKCNKNYREDGNVYLKVLRYDKPTGKYYQPEAKSSWIPVDGQ
ncbi:hypothetical protein [Streptomyces sp. Tu6071]|uniref:hypothetical protein n=1 Tax=Streptomyces sp. Tu6071 TaxID=355249 RepID=UPI002D21CF80|nr:hypothetical protein [Streptomyces sp. Tu6071]